MIVNRPVAPVFLLLLATVTLSALTLHAESDPTPAPASDPAPAPSPNIFSSPQHNDRTRPDSPCLPARLDSPFIPVDSWIYPAVLRLYGLGFVDNVYLGMRPWTRSERSKHAREPRAHSIEDADPARTRPS